MRRELVLTAAGGLAVGMAVAAIGPVFAEDAPLAAPSPTPPPAGRYDPMTSFAPLVDAVNPAVVAIKVESEVDAPQIPPAWRDFFGERFDPGMPQLRHGEGSGFVVSDDGLVVTNAHVVARAESIKAVFHDGTEVTAKVLGKDDAMDLALLRLEGDKDWDHVELGSSEDLRVGDWVVAMGNPLGLGNTVTAGIVSGKGRMLGHDIFGNEDFIQTDAAINQGNSGGPLFDLHGRVVGINTAIIQGANTVGFAIPVDLLQSVMSDLETKGKVARGYLGVRPQALDEELAAALKIDRTQGAVVGQVYDDTPADQSGLRSGDVILSIDGEEIEDPQALVANVARRRPGDAVQLGILRDGKEKDVRLVLGERPGDDEVATGQAGGSVSELGLGLTELPKEVAATTGIGRGVLVESVKRGSPADGRLRPGDVIVEVNRRPVGDPDDLAQLLARSSGVVMLSIVRGDVGMLVTLQTD